MAWPDTKLGVALGILGKTYTKSSASWLSESFFPKQSFRVHLINALKESMRRLTALALVHGYELDTKLDLLSSMGVAPRGTCARMSWESCEIF